MNRAQEFPRRDLSPANQLSGVGRLQGFALKNVPPPATVPDMHRPVAHKPLPVFKNVLLVDPDVDALRNRAIAIRRLKLSVVCANSFARASSLWHSGLYELVLIDKRGNAPAALELCLELKRYKAQQRIAFFVPGAERIAVWPELTLTSEIHALPLELPPRGTGVKPRDVNCLSCNSLIQSLARADGAYLRARLSAFCRVSSEGAARMQVDIERAKSDLEEHWLLCAGYLRG